MSYDPRVVSAIRQIWQRRGLPRRYLVGAYDTGLVESNLQDLPGGDADSYGFRQQRASVYGHQPLKQQINNLFNEFKQYDTGQPLGQLIADVQRPAEQYRGRYSQQSILDQARQLASQGGLGGGAPSGVLSTPSMSPSPTNDTQSVQQPNLFQYFAQTATNPTLQRGWELLSNIKAMQDQGSASPTNGNQSFPTGGPAASSGTDRTEQQILNQANKIEAAHVPYLWGGGHQAHQVAPGSPVTPLDCSGAVSRALGIDPRVASDFEKWGHAGQGKHVTIWAKDDHVLMEIDGHFWGTSNSNPGGGAGWIPRNVISPDYLKQFTPRHPAGE